MVHFSHQDGDELNSPQNEQEEKSMKKLLGLFLALIMLVSCTAALADDPIVLTYALDVQSVPYRTIKDNMIFMDKTAHFLSKMARDAQVCHTFY